MRTADSHRVRRLLCIVLLCFLGCPTWAQTGTESLRMRIVSADGEPARVHVQGEELGTTGEVLEFDVTGYKEPLFLDIVLSRPGNLPTLHTLEVPSLDKIWEPPPLAIVRKSQEVTLRVEPPPQKVYRETEDGALEPAGSGSYLTLETGALPLNQPFQTNPVTVHLQREGYVTDRVVLPPEVWFSAVYPPKEKPAIQLLKAPGWRAWWTRSLEEKPLLLFVVPMVWFALISIGAVRYHYLRKVEAAHASLSQWVERLDTLVVGSRELAAPLTIEELAECTLLQARRLCRSDWEAFYSLSPGLGRTTDPEPDVQLEKLSRFMEKKRTPIRVDDVASTRFLEYVDGSRSLLVQPLLFKREYYGMLVLGKSEPAGFSETDQEALEVLASQTAASVERIRLHAETVDAYEKLKESEAQLIQSAKMAAVGQLAAGVAHELNTPLNAISFGVEMAESSLTKTPDRAAKRLALVKNAARRAGEIVKKLLYYSREARLEEQDISLAQLVDDTASFIRFQLEQDELELALNQCDDVALKGNLSELNQVLTNLILNARDSVLKGDHPRKITVSTLREDSLVRVEVEDYGPGVPEEVSDRIFDPFFTTKELGEGTGLGLSISRKIVEKHGGRLLVESLANPCRFVMELPIR